MMSMNGEHPKTWDMDLAKLIHLTDPECIGNADLCKDKQLALRGYLVETCSSVLKL